ncbi:hypothetical protein CR205_18365 [Alteribacter lacisalsi]|uniref:SpoVT-AbrB domain-containing protein n=1 Tax=Alteribacter lacisalsi TaxID=2045244 RepID=A0A2W0HPJ7_9BACI|nr:AbrB/MazE/SpoVT family DNA-binding domain-containing protein [Alteribacter lacisalsi]PYZ95498.1 hypothetical protein CR205_18365 [Alteribacter lacisalsi]
MGTNACAQTAQEWINTNLVCRMNKAFSVTIPKKLREQLEIEAHSKVILVVDNEQVLVSSKSINETLDIQSHLNENGSFYLAREIRDQLGLKPGATFELYVGSDPGQLCELLLRPVTRG